MGVPRPSQPTQTAALGERDPLPGLVVNGKFRVLSVLAKGGMGKIYRAEQVPLGRPVALKVLRTRFADDGNDDPQFHKRFFLEASILSRLQHANIVTLYDYGRIENVETEQYFMAMEFLNGDTLARRIKQTGGLHPRDVLKTFRQIARGLREAHKQDIVHRDLKPSNVMLVPDEDGGEVVKILDFGIGKILNDSDSQQELTAEGAFLGSPRYMAPEQINEGRVDPRTDIYSMGVMLYEASCGKVPFEGDTNINTMMMHCNQPLPAMRDRSPDVQVPAALENLARHCLQKDGAARPQTMEGFIRELSACEVAIFGQTTATSSGPYSMPDMEASGPASSDGARVSGAHVALPRVSLTGLDQPSASTPPPTGTHRSLTVSRSQFPVETAQDEKKKRSAVPLVIGGAVVLAMALAVVVAVEMRKPHDASAAGGALPTAPATAAAAATSYTLSIDSVPSPAQVYEGEVFVGTTPLMLPIDRSQVKAASRRFLVKLDGYEPYTILQGDSETNVHVVAPLARLPGPAVTVDASADPGAPSATGKRNPGAWPVTAPATTTATATTAATQSRPPPPPPEPDIKLRR